MAARICRGYRPGVIGRITEMHASYYARQAGFGIYFEGKVAMELAEFCARLDRAGNGLWTVVRAGQALGSIAIDAGGDEKGRQAAASAHLRWFILDEAVRGQGLGRLLLAEALAHCDAQGVETVHLWTFSGLDAARHLYESTGFRLVEERPGTQWGREVAEQRFVRIGRSR